MKVFHSSSRKMAMPWLVFLLFGFAGPGLAQDAYYWAGTEKMYLSADPSHLILNFKEPVPVSTLQFSTREVKSMELPPRSEVPFAIIEMVSPNQGNALELAQQLGISPRILESASFALRHEDGQFLGLSHRVLLRKGTNFDPEQFEILTSAFPVLKVKPRSEKELVITLSDVEQVLPLANTLHESGMTDWCLPDFITRVKKAAVNDPYYSSLQWYLNNTGQSVRGGTSTPGIDINVEDAWNLTKGRNDVIVALIDEGLEPHEDLEDSLGISRVLPGYNAANPGQPATPTNSGDGHGVSCAGIIAASHNNLGVAGIAPFVKVMGAKIEFGPTFISQIQASFTWAWQNGADVINCSWSFENTCTPNPYPNITQAINDARTLGRNGLGTIVLFASGNDSSCVNFPANLPGTISVGAVSNQGTTTNYANFGPELDLVAPSSTSEDKSNCVVIDRMGNLGFNQVGNSWDLPNPNYTGWFGGTSTSTAQATGVAALMVSANPALTEAQIANILRTTPTDMGPVGKDDNFGYGRLNAFDAVTAALNANTFPVEWLGISARPLENRVRVEWTTATEVNNAYFLVERSQDGKEFEPLETLPGNGDSKQAQSYVFDDLAPLPGRAFYRIRQVDIDGKFSFSPVVEVYLNASQTTLVSQPFPNPTTGLASVNIVSEGNFTIPWSLVDPQGRKIKSGETTMDGGTGKIEISTSKLAPGIYQLVVFRGSEKPILRKISVIR